MLSEAECKNSGGWFKDPFTGQDIGPDYPRVITCKSGEKWQQPAICFQDGNIVKISGRCWNDDERACYKEYRGLPSKPRAPREPKPVKQKPIEQESNTPEPEQEKQVVKYNSECTASAKILTILAECDCCLGITRIADIFYALVMKRGSNTVYHIPRSLIPDAEFDRICSNSVS